MLNRVSCRESIRKLRETFAAEPSAEHSRVMNEAQQRGANASAVKQPTRTFFAIAYQCEARLNVTRIERLDDVDEL